MKTDNIRIAQRLRQFGKTKFGTMKDFSTALGMHPASLNSGYLSGRSLPGSEMLIRLLSLGCDVIWLLTGVNRPGISDEERKILLRLNTEGITTEEQLDEKLKIVNDVWGAVAKIAEVQEKYVITRKPSKSRKKSK